MICCSWAETLNHVSRESVRFLLPFAIYKKGNDTRNLLHLAPMTLHQHRIIPYQESMFLASHNSLTTTSCKVTRQKQMKGILSVLDQNLGKTSVVNIMNTNPSAMEK